MLVLVIVTVAPGTVAPVGSVTVPTIDPAVELVPTAALRTGESKKK